MSSQNATSSISGQRRRFAVLLLAHGTPESIDEIPEYLNNVVSGRPLPQHVVEEIQRRYAQIGKSPLTEWTYRQAELLRSALNLPVYVGMRNWKPYIAETVRTMRADGITDAVAICLAPQNSRTSVGLYRRAVYAEGGSALRFHFIDGWADHPRLADAFAERLRGVWKQACTETESLVPILFTAHSVPCRTIQTPEPQNLADVSEPPARVGKTHPQTDARIRPTSPERSYATPGGIAAGPDPYAVEAKLTAALVAAQLAGDGLTRDAWFFAFQSQGASGGPWIGPAVEETLEALRREGHPAVVLQPIGFLCDHVEILYDIDIAFQRRAQQLGLRLWRTESLNNSPLLIDALADLARTGLAMLGFSREAAPALA